MFTKDRVIGGVSDMDYVGDTETLDVHMRRLPAEVEETLRQPEWIVTIRDLGYGCQLAP